jgi:hypothetical protein
VLCDDRCTFLRGEVYIAGECGFDSIIVVSDCLSLVSKINCSLQDVKAVGGLVHCIKLKSATFRLMVSPSPRYMVPTLCG